jgi:hypothetical protein
MLTALLWGIVALSVHDDSPNPADVERIGSQPVAAAPSDRSDWDTGARSFLTLGNGCGSV